MCSITSLIVQPIPEFMAVLFQVLQKILWTGLGSHYFNVFRHRMEKVCSKMIFVCIRDIKLNFRFYLITKEITSISQIMIPPYTTFFELCMNRIYFVYKMLGSVV